MTIAIAPTTIYPNELSLYHYHYHSVHKAPAYKAPVYKALNLVPNSYNMIPK